MDRELLKKSGWKFASCFTEKEALDHCERINETHRGADRVYINATQDCSIISPNLEAEPWLEYFAAIPLANEDGMFTNARNIRKLHVELEVNGENKWYELKMAYRGFISRENLDETSPSKNVFLTEDSLRVFKRWLANRYIAQTFPDDFNARTYGLIKSSRSPLIRLFNSETGRACNSIFITLTPNDRDLDQGESYKLNLVLLFSNEKAEELGYEAIDVLASNVKTAIEAVDGLEVESVNSLAEQDISYDQLVKMVRWQFDYVSLATSEEIAPVEHCSI